MDHAIWYFSGTGNTKDAAEVIAGRLTGAAALIEAGRTQVRELADAIIADRERRYRRTGPLWVLLSIVGALFRFLARRLLGQLYVADDRCTSCGFCEKVCPVGAIAVKAGRRPRWRPTCESCNRCINVCPEQAVNSSWFRLGALLTMVTAASIVLIRGFDAVVWDRLAPLGGVAGFGVDLARLLVAIGLVTAAHAAYFGVAPLVHRIEHLRPLHRLTYASFTARTRRYVLPGFRPPVRR